MLWWAERCGWGRSGRRGYFFFSSDVKKIGWSGNPYVGWRSRGGRCLPHRLFAEFENNSDHSISVAEFRDGVRTLRILPLGDQSVRFAPAAVALV